jgi:ATP phosphoribosyltransferase regulatory subunit
MGISGAPEAAFSQIRDLAGARRATLEAALAVWDERLAAIGQSAPADRLRFATALGHAFDYYDGFTFEVRSEAVGDERPVAVGGRYDGLLARLGGTGGGRAVGCMVRPWRAFAGGEA